MRLEDIFGNNLEEEFETRTNEELEEVYEDELIFQCERDTQKSLL